MAIYGINRHRPPATEGAKPDCKTPVIHSLMHIFEMIKPEVAYNVLNKGKKSEHNKD